MSADETQPARPPSAATGESPGKAPGAAPSRPGYGGGSAEPKTVRIDRPGPPSYQPPPEYQQPPQYQPPPPQYQPPRQYQPPPAPPSPAWPPQPPEYRAGGPRPRRRRRGRRITMSVFGIIVVLILLVIGDIVAKAVAENQIAGQIKQADSQVSPSVSIRGFPFLTQVIARDIHEIDISASNVAAGPVSITSVNAVAKGVHVNGSFNGGKVDTITATAFIGYASLSSALSSESNGIANLALSSAGNGKVKASFGVLGASVLTETGKITLKGNQVSLVFTGDNSGLGGVISGLAGGSSGPGLANLDFTIPKLPAGVQITSFTVGPQGITMMGSAHNTTLSQ